MYPTDFFDERSGKVVRFDKSEKKAKKEKKKNKPSREERGYTEPRGKKFKKEDWMKFLHPES